MSKQPEDEMEVINCAASCVAIDQPAISFWRISAKDFSHHPWQPGPSINPKTISTCCYRHSSHSRHSHSGGAAPSEANQTVLHGNPSAHYEIRKDGLNIPNLHFRESEEHHSSIREKCSPSHTKEKHALSRAVDSCYEKTKVLRRAKIKDIPNRMQLSLRR